MDDVPDGELVTRALGGSREAVDAVFARSWPVAWWSSYSVLGDREGADETAQEAILRVFSSLDRFDRTRPLRPWVARIATNQALNVLRTRGREIPVEFVPEVDVPDLVDGVAERDALIRALRDLPHERRMVVAMRYFGGLEPTEIAHALDVPVGTVSSRLSRALTELRTLLGGAHRR